MATRPCHPLLLAVMLLLQPGAQAQLAADPDPLDTAAFLNTAASFS
jgi:hypothetical protein